MRRTLEKQVRQYIEDTIEGYINGIRDCDYEYLTRDQWKNYVIDSLRIDAESGMIVNGVEFKHLYFAGKAEIERMTYKYIDTYKDMQEYIVR